ncbi:MAG: hypothetical protein IKU45_06075 [Clostridia bacterium]|nr:hypothetical protein [Clostridia bacterium]
MANNEQNNQSNITEKDLYKQACGYFYYHAEQRTNMINYFIAVFGASVALYGALLGEYAPASAFIGAFMFVVSFLFYNIDLRNRFDVKHSQSVICQMEKDIGADIRKEGADCPYGVFSNEDDVFAFYGISARRKNKIYKELKQNQYDSAKFEELIAKYKDELNISEKELRASINSRGIVSLSQSIKMLYYVCMGISVLAFALSICIISGVITL